MQTTTLERPQPQNVETRRAERRPKFHPHTDIVEAADHVLLLADMPGVDDGSVEVTVHKDVLTVEGRPQRAAREGYRLMHREHYHGDYQRTFRLSDEVDVERIEAAVKDGVLRVTLPKAEAARSHKIQVKAL